MTWHRQRSTSKKNVRGFLPTLSLVGIQPLLPGPSKFKAIKASLESNGLVPRQHQHHKPQHALCLADVQYVVTYITNYVEDNAILLPGRIPGYKRDDVILLPSSTTKMAVYSSWECFRCVSCWNLLFLYAAFWQQLLPQIIVCKPMLDLCWICQQNSMMIMRAHSRLKGGKSEASVTNFLLAHPKTNTCQPGPIYLLTPRKAALFGIYCEAIPCQVNFIID